MTRNRRTSQRRRGTTAPSEPGESRDRWLLSYADLITLLLALFIVLFASADHQRAITIASAVASQFIGEGGATPAGNGVLPGGDSFIAAQTAIEAAFKSNATLRDRARVTITERGLVVSLTEAGFFAPGDATMRADALPLLAALAEKLGNSDVPVRIEGHTDSTPISTARFPSNWELSAARAATVLGKLEGNGISSSRLSVAGFAGERPVADNATAAGRALNRRVDIVVLRSR